MFFDKLSWCFPIEDQLVVLVAKVFLVLQCIAAPVVLQRPPVVVFEAVSLFSPVERGIFLVEFSRRFLIYASKLLELLPECPLIVNVGVM